jgi:O-antigen/teichoic acid export membrane protein
MLSIAGATEYAFQLILPVILVRYLSPAEFGDYRLLWLLATTAMALFPLSMPHSLFHFLPNAAPTDHPRFIGNTWLFVAFSGLAASLFLVTIWNWMPESVLNLRQYSTTTLFFVALWIAGSTLDVLPTADGNPRWQATAIVTLATVRTATLGLVAITTRDLQAVILAMCLIAFVRFILIPIYGLKFATVRGLALDIGLLRTQVRYSLPFAVGGALFLLRVQSDQWIVAAHFPAEVFALISIAAIVLSVSNLVRQPIINATLPRLSTLVGLGQFSEASRLQATVYATLSLLLLPILGLLFVVAPELVEIVYTRQYVGAAPLMQIYLIGQMVCVIAAGHLLIILDAGRLATLISSVCLVVSVVVSLIGLQLFGLYGAALGSVASLVLGEAWALSVAAKRLRTRVTMLIDWHSTGRAAATVIIGLIVGSVARQFASPDWNAWFRLAYLGATFGTAIFAGGVAMGLQGNFRLHLARLRNRT